MDSTGLPAAARWLEDAPPGATVHLVSEVDDPVEHGDPLPHRDGLKVIRLVLWSLVKEMPGVRLR